MAQKRAIKLAQVQDLDALEARITKIGNEGLKAAVGAVKAANKLNEPLIVARRSYNDLNKPMFSELNRIYKDLNVQFKALGIEMPSELKNRFTVLEKLMANYASKITDNMLQTKNVINNNY